MAARTVRKRRTAQRRPRIAMPREVRAAYGEIQKGVKHLDASIADIRAGLRRAERTIEANARRRISALRKEARAELRTLQGRQREAARALKKLSAAAGESWRDVKRSADALIADARSAAADIAKRFRNALQS
jgi:hypothetical protein